MTKIYSLRPLNMLLVKSAGAVVVKNHFCLTTSGRSLNDFNEGL